MSNTLKPGKFSYASKNLLQWLQVSIIWQMAFSHAFRTSSNNHTSILSIFFLLISSSSSKISSNSSQDTSSTDFFVKYFLIAMNKMDDDYSVQCIDAIAVRIATPIKSYSIFSTEHFVSTRSHRRLSFA